MRKVYLILITVILTFNLWAQQDTTIATLTSQLRRAKTNLERFGITYKIAIYYTDRGNNDSLKVVSQQLYDLAQVEKNDSLRVFAYNSTAVYFSSTGNFPLALEYYFKALNLAQSKGYFAWAGVLNTNIGYAYVLMGNYPQATLYGRKAVQNLQNGKGRQFMLVAAYDNLAIAFLEQKKADSALYFTQQANTLNLKAQNTVEQSFIFYQFARIYFLLGDRDLAESYFKKSIAYSTTHVNPVALSTAATHFCSMLLESGRVSEAKQVGALGLDAAVKSGLKRQAIDNAEVLRELYDKQKQIDSAYYYSKLANAYRDSVFNEQKNLQSQNVIFSQQLHEKEVAEEKKNEEMERAHNLQNATIALALVTFVVLFFVLSHSIIANERLIKFLGILALLIVFEFLNLLLHPYVGNLTHHSPILMLGIMVCLAALLIPLHHKLEHWITHKLVEKNNRIRLAAAKKTIGHLEKRVDGNAAEKSTNAQQ
jgi:tetratricopeptide (TPR) repeat protein